MGKIRAGILSKLTGKVAGVVGGTWKDVNYLREYVIPANPKTAGQVLQRTKFADTVNFAKPLVGPVFNTHTDKFQKSMSGFNFFIKSNIAVFVPNPDLSNVNITEGKLFMDTIYNRTADAGLDTVTWNSNVGLGANGKDLDLIYSAAYNEDTNIWGFGANPYNREDGNALQTINLVMSPGDNIALYLYATQFIGLVLQDISISVNNVNPAA